MDSIREEELRLLAAQQNLIPESSEPIHNIQTIIIPAGTKVILNNEETVLEEDLTLMKSVKISAEENRGCGCGCGCDDH